MLSSDNASSPPLRVKQDEFNLLHILGILLFGIANIPSSYLARPARSFSPAALPHPSADRTHRAAGCLPASPPVGAGAGGSPPRPQRSRRKRQQLSSVQLEPGRGGSGSPERRPRVALQVCVSGYSGPGGLGCARLPSDAGGNSANGIYVLFFGNSFYKHHWARRAPKNSGNAFHLSSKPAPVLTVQLICWHFNACNLHLWRVLCLNTTFVHLLTGNAQESVWV